MQQQLVLAHRFRRALVAEHVHAPEERSGADGGETAAHAIDELDNHRDHIARHRRSFAHHQLPVHTAYWPDRVDERIQDMQPRAGHAARGRFRRRIAPCARRVVRMFIAEMTFDMQDLAELARSRDTLQRLHRGPQTPVVPDREHDARATARLYHRRSVGDVERKRFLAEYLLAGGGRCFDHRAMQRMWGREDHGFDRGIAKYGAEVGTQWKTVFPGKFAQPIRRGVDAADKADALALALHGLDKILAPSAEADDRSVYHGFPTATSEPAECVLPLNIR